ncbi:MAG: tail fiber domain-containing protein [Prolixibacteraceae bacterium]|nr:tail fiber domain-containing protein [Prolixibacteraceae bacterium]
MVLLLSMAILPFGLKAQISVDAYGNVKMLNSPGFVKVYKYYDTPTFEPETHNTGRIGVSGRQFFEIRGQYHYATSTLLTSDKRLKENFRSIDNSLEKVLQLEGKKFDYIADASDSTGDEKEKQKRIKMKKDQLGFVAQEVIEILPEAVHYEEEADRYYINYDAIIPVIVEALKVLSSEVDELKNKSSLKSASLDTENLIEETKEASLGQNVPNPFSNTTTINMYLPESISTAKLYLYTMQGEQVSSHPVQQRGNTFVTIEGYTLDAGMYLYTLIADGKEVDTKKMILTK